MDIIWLLAVAAFFVGSDLAVGLIARLRSED